MIKVMLISIALYIYFFLIKNIQDRLKNTDKQYDVAIVYLFSLLHPKMKMLSLINKYSKPVKALFVFRTQFKIFWMKTRRLVTVPLTA